MELFKNRLGIGLVTFYIIGIYIGTHFFSKFFIIISVLSAVLFIFLGIFLFKNTKRTVSFGLCACFVLLIIGATYSNFTELNRQRELREFIGEDCMVYGTVITSPALTQRENHYSVTVDVHKINENAVNGRIILYVSRLDNTAPKVNQCIYFYTSLEAPDYEDGNFNYNEFLRTKNVYATGFTKRVYPYTGYDRPFSLIGKLKEFGREINLFFCDRIDKLFNYDNDAKAMLKGILLGEKSDFSKELTNNLSLSGFSHIAAVSGLHLNILFGALCGLLGFVRVHRKLMIFITLPVILLFASVTGFTPSVCRSAIMLSLCLLAFIFKKEYDSLSALFFSAFVILLVNPYSLYSISFILSFVSTLAIILLYNKIYGIFTKLIENPPALIKCIMSSLSVSAATFISTVPFIAYYFSTVSFSSFIANIWVIPITTPIFICGYLLCIFSPILPQIVCKIIVYFMATLIEILIKTASLFADIGFLHFEIANFPPVYILLYFMLVGGIYKFIKMRLKE